MQNNGYYPVSAKCKTLVTIQYQQSAKHWLLSSISKVQNIGYYTVSAKCKTLVTIQYQQSAKHWLLYSITPNVTTPFTERSHAVKFALYFLLQNLPGRCLFSNSNHRKVFTPIYQSLHLIPRHFLQQRKIID